ncbi:MAG: FKBP-type peptidyl-prolyl cis-trans isomerase [Myxococcales bacterium]
MPLARFVCGALLALAMRGEAQTGKHESEHEEREERERAKSTGKSPATPGDEEALYAMGAILGAKVNSYGLSKKELQTVERGFADAAANRKLRLADPDLEEWGPKVETFLQRKGSPRLTAEKDKGRKIAQQMAKENGARTLPSGVVVVTEREGNGPRPAATDKVRVKYEGKLVDGKSFDQSESAEFPLNQVIPCWTQGVQQIKAGGKARLVCPSDTAYGDQGRPPQIPAGATLVFTVELLAVGGK